MSVGKVNGNNQEYTQLYATIQKQAEAKKVSIKVFDANNDGKISLLELKLAQKQIPTMFVGNEEVQLEEYDKKGNLIKTSRRDANGEFINASTYTYSKQGKLEKITFLEKDGVVGTATYQYHQNGNLKSETTKFKDGSTSVFNYDKNGNMIP